MFTRIVRRVAIPRIPSHRFYYTQRAMSSFTLDKNIFNPTLYKNIHNVWFEGYDPKASGQF